MSLKFVSAELQKFFGSMFFEWDVELYDPIMDEPAKANTSDLNEELGQVGNIFCQLQSKFVISCANSNRYLSVRIYLHYSVMLHACTAIEMKHVHHRLLSVYHIDTDITEGKINTD